MDLGGGSFVLEPAMDKRLSAELKQSGALTLELTITPESRPRGTVAIVTALAQDGGVNLALEQRYDTLIASLRLDTEVWSVDLFPLRLGQAHHVVVTYRPGQFLAYLNGERYVERTWSGNFDHWVGQQLILGTGFTSDSPPSAGRWQGSLEGFAIYDRPLGGEEIRQQHTAQSARWRQRRPTPRLVVDAELLRQRPIPDPGIYPQTLVVYDYRVSRVHAGAYDGETLLVAHWGALNGAVQPPTRDRRPGQSYRLTLERFDEHPELQSLKIIGDGDRLDLPLFHDPMSISD